MSTYRDFAQLRETILTMVREGAGTTTVSKLVEALLDPNKAELHAVFWSALQNLLSTGEIHFSGRDAEEQAKLAMGSSTADAVWYQFNGWYHVNEAQLSFWVPRLSIVTVIGILDEFRGQDIANVAIALSARFGELGSDLVPTRLLNGLVVVPVLWRAYSGQLVNS